MNEDEWRSEDKQDFLGRMIDVARERRNFYKILKPSC